MSNWQRFKNTLLQQGSTILWNFILFPEKRGNTFWDNESLPVKHNYFVCTRLGQGDYKKYWKIQMGWAAPKVYNVLRYVSEIHIKKYVHTIYFPFCFFTMVYCRKTYVTVIGENILAISGLTRWPNNCIMQCNSPHAKLMEAKSKERTAECISQQYLGGGCRRLNPDDPLPCACAAGGEKQV